MGRLIFQPTMVEGREAIDLVADIIMKPFSRQTFQEKLDILRTGQYTPVALYNRVMELFFRKERRMDFVFK